MASDQPQHIEMGRAVIDGALSSFRANKAWADKAIVQLSDDKLHLALDPSTSAPPTRCKHRG